jgi:gliding motility-associated-like protein
LSVTNEWGCTGYDTILITYDPTVVVVLPVLSVYVPDIFSPNGDDSNDWYFIQGKGIESLNLMIFDRCGEKVFENRGVQANEESEGWNGKYRGKPVKVGSFKYVVSGMYIDGTKIKKAGDLLLVR